MAFQTNKHFPERSALWTGFKIFFYSIKMWKNDTHALEWENTKSFLVIFVVFLSQLLISSIWTYKNILNLKYNFFLYKLSFLATMMFTTRIGFSPPWLTAEGEQSKHLPYNFFVQTNEQCFWFSFSIPGDLHQLL